MEKTFKFESENFETDIEVMIEFSCRDSDGCDCEIDSIAMFIGDEEIKPERLAKGEMSKIETKAQEIADENGYEAYQDYAQGAGDAAYDAWKDRQMEEGE